MSTEAKTFAARARQRMEELNLTVGQLARRLDVASSNVSMYLGGTRSPKEDTIQRYAEALECDADWLADRAPTHSVRVREPSPEEFLAGIIRRWDIDDKRKAVLQAVLTAKDTEVDSLAKLLRVAGTVAAKNKDKSSAG